jgi:hypothetical protein
MKVERKPMIGVSRPKYAHDHARTRRNVNVEGMKVEDQARRRQAHQVATSTWKE